MNKQLQSKEQPNQPDQPDKPEYKDQPLPDTKSKKRQSVDVYSKEGKIIRSLNEMPMPLN